MLRTVPIFLRTRTTFVRFAFATALFPTLLSFTQNSKDSLDCLNLTPQEREYSLQDRRRDNCFRDELGFSNDINLQHAAKQLGISASEVIFIGCNKAPFSTRIDRSEPQLHFEILYNTTVDRGAGMIAILHELGHIYQLKQAGSREGLLSSAHQDLKRVELGADYLSGFAIGRLNLSEKDFVVGLALVGSFEVQSAPHGLPHERSTSFNYGVTAGKTLTDLGSLYDTFQDEDYGIIKRSR